jgi:hypothetical protein
VEWRHEIGAVLEQVRLVGVQKRKLVFDLVRCQAVPCWRKIWFTGLSLLLCELLIYYTFWQGCELFLERLHRP